MDSHFNQGSRACDDCEDFSYDLSLAVYGAFPTLPRSRASSPTSKAPPSKAAHGANDFNPCRKLIQMSRIPTKQAGHQQRMEHQQSTCLNLNIESGDSTESEFWILPDFDDWEADQEASVAPVPSERESDMGTLLRRAAKSNLERLRTRLEGDGWDFVGERYGRGTKNLEESAGQDEESVDDEFDVVILPAVRAPC